MLHERGEAPPIAELMREPLWITPDTPLRDALAKLQQSRAAIAIVGDGETPLGVVTIKDLVEPITGELVRW